MPRALEQAQYRYKAGLVTYLEVSLDGDNRASGSKSHLYGATSPPHSKGQRVMVAVIHDALRAAIEAEPRPYWWHSCVLIEPFEKADYLKIDSHG
jgi:hypothetical protein